MLASIFSLTRILGARFRKNTTLLQKSITIGFTAQYNFVPKLKDIRT